MSEIVDGLVKPTVLPRLLLSQKSSTSLDHRSAENVRAKFASSSTSQGLQHHGSDTSLNIPFFQSSSCTKATAKPVFDYDVAILYNTKSLPLAMTLLDLLQKEGHQAYAEISADRWSGTPDLNQSAFNMHKAQHLVSFISKPHYSGNLFFKTELLFAGETGKDVFLFKSNQDQLPPWIERLVVKKQNVVIPTNVVLSQPGDVTANMKTIFEYLGLKIFPRNTKPPPQFWSKEETAEWLESVELSQLSEIFISGAYVHMLANEWQRSPKTMRAWTKAVIEEECGVEKAEEAINKFHKALTKLFPEMNL